MDKQWKVVPVEPTPEMLDEIHLLPDFTEQALRVRYAAMLAAAPQPPSASDERERFEAWGLAGCEMVDDPASSRMDIARHCAWQAWQARAALAPSPGVDAAEQKPVVFMAAQAVRDVLADEPWTDGAQCEVSQRQTAVFDTPLFAAPSPAASADEWMAEVERLTDEYADAERHWYVQQLTPSRIEARTAARAALLAHLKVRP